MFLCCRLPSSSSSSSFLLLALQPSSGLTCACQGFKNFRFGWLFFFSTPRCDAIWLGERNSADFIDSVLRNAPRTLPRSLKIDFSKKEQRMDHKPSFLADDFFFQHKGWCRCQKNLEVSLLLASLIFFFFFLLTSCLVAIFCSYLCMSGLKNLFFSCPWH